MANKAASFKEFVQIEQDLLTARLNATRAAIQHAGEKGRALEEAARRLIRSFLPAEYGLSTGFVAYQAGDGSIRLSKQLDIIIFDAIRGAPLMSLDTCNVFPVESVYAYVEVKATLTSSKNLQDPAGTSLEKCLLDNHDLREMRYRNFWMPTGDSPNKLEKLSQLWIPIRSYIFAFEGKGGFKDLDKLAQRVSDVCANVDAHMHGVFVTDLGFMHTKAIDPKKSEPADWYHTAAIDQYPLIYFKTAMLGALATFSRPPHYAVPALENYYNVLPQWKDFQPIAADSL